VTLTAPGKHSYYVALFVSLCLEPFRVVASNVNLLERQSDDLPFLLRELRLCAEGMAGVSLVVLDTLNAMMCGGDENSSVDMGAMIDGARQIMAVLGCSVLFVHHSGKDEMKGSRGHSSLKAALDCEIQITDNGAGHVAKLTKSRDGEAGLQFPFRLDPVDLGPDLDDDAEPGDRIASCVVVPLDHVEAVHKGKAAAIPKSAALALRALCDAISEHGVTLPATSAIPPGARGVSVGQWRERYYVMDPLEGTADKLKEANSRLVRFRRAKDGLLNCGAIMACSDWVWIT
jgi:AAA domain